ncbi:Synerg-CTERM sorting domain-containing protein [Fretibacterium sp. OH1220_COT-178]|uniref:Synerg-CTERM sorting domain-containing protein n=1 Tax=Fretibacterium sp. OH1220_COT-178 TaxID=2491047 RepID=UPI000F5F5292|nr:Synerg-CTERM sorting domain-containing protein [Fretibacterium sp. OH1220_COT-178]RRD63223.1 SYNERG-CTERM sorting domain-containing protein [Fretibacterium sp. OH1220_COT-178]
MRKRLRGVKGIVILGVALLLALPTAFGAEVKLWSDVADTSWLNQHAGTEADPYLIETAEHLAGLAKLVSDGNDFKDKYVLLTRDITMAGREWSPIGWMCAYGDLAGFAGTFDGGGHAVRGVTISTGAYLPRSPATGALSHSGSFFGHIAPTGTVKDVTVMGSITNRKSNGAAGITSWVDGNILNCTTSFDLRGSSPANSYVGGIASLNGGGMIRNCVTFGTAKAVEAGGFPYAGGILGFSYWNKGALENCTALCSEVESEMDAGGVVGGFSPMPEIFRYCVSVCDSVKAQPAYTGGIVGAYGYGWTDCYWLKVKETQPSEGWGTSPGAPGKITDPAQLPVASVVLDAADVRTMLVGETRKIRARPYPSTGDLSGLKYRWTAERGLTVLSGTDGPEIEVKAASEGLYRISLAVTGALGVPVASDDAALTPGAVLKVVNALPPVTGIALGAPNHALKEGESVTLTASTIPLDAQPTVLSWSVTKAEGQGASVEDLLLEDHGNGTAAVTLKKQYKDGASYVVTVRSAGGQSAVAAATVWGEALGAEPNMPGFVPIGVMLPGGAEGKRPFGVRSGLAADLLPEMGAVPEDFRLGGDGLLYPSRARLETVMEALGKQEGVKLSGASPFPLIALEVSKPRTLAAVGFWVEGKRFRASAPKDVALFGVRPGGTGELFRYAENPRDYLDGHFAVQRKDGSVMKGDAPFAAEETYGLVVYVRDGGRPDGNPVERKVALSAVLAKNASLPGPVSPDVSPDIKPPVSSDIPGPVSPDDSRIPERGVAPALPEGTNGEIASVKPELVLGDGPSDSLDRAVRMLSECGLEKGDLDVDRRTGLVRLNADMGWDLSERVVSSDGFIDQVKSLPVLTASLPEGTSVAAVGIELTGAALLAEEASEVRVLKVTGADSVQLMKYAGSAAEFGDGRFTVLEGNGRLAGDLSRSGRYVLTLFIKDGGEYDLDGRANGRIVDPALLLSVEPWAAQTPKPKPKPGPETPRSGSSGGCDAGFLWGWLLLAAAVPVVRRRRG